MERKVGKAERQHLRLRHLAHRDIDGGLDVRTGQGDLLSGRWIGAKVPLGHPDAPDVDRDRRAHLDRPGGVPGADHELGRAAPDVDHQRRRDDEPGGQPAHRALHLVEVGERVDEPSEFVHPPDDATLAAEHGGRVLEPGVVHVAGDRGVDAVAHHEQHRHVEAARVKRRKTIEEHHQLLARIRAEMETTAATESRLEAMIQADMVKLEPGSKRLMDVLRITARNGFYQALQPFRKSYDNYRDDHGQFRHLTLSPGVLEVSSTEVLIHLFPSGSYGGELQRIVNRTLEAINQQKLEHPKLPGRRLRFRLAQRSELDIKVRTET